MPKEIECQKYKPGDKFIIEVEKRIQPFIFQEEINSYTIKDTALALNESLLDRLERVNPPEHNKDMTDQTAASKLQDILSELNPDSDYAHALRVAIEALKQKILKENNGENYA